jgi:hypothetical protein
MDAVIQFLAVAAASLLGLWFAVSMFPKEPIIDDKDKFPDGMA